MSDRFATAAKSGIFLIVAAGLSWFTWAYAPDFFFPLMFVIGFILLMVGAQGLESWQQRRKAGSKATAAQRRRAADQRRRALAFQGTQEGFGLAARDWSFPENRLVRVSHGW